ncbi:hypothetical protein RUM44_005009 [Polyplax serrata]|uniref:LAGLIDADG homing endonuclease n=1 Tax=Polyplax serrata TaxID=468196 RepID=A0ABR1AWQ0_POLSC
MKILTDPSLCLELFANPPKSLTLKSELKFYGLQRGHGGCAFELDVRAEESRKFHLMANTFYGRIDFYCLGEFVRGLAEGDAYERALGRMSQSGDRAKLYRHSFSGVYILIRQQVGFCNRKLM